MARPPRKKGGKGRGGDEESKVLHLPGFEPHPEAEQPEEEPVSLTPWSRRKARAVRRRAVAVGDGDVVEFFLECVAGGLPRDLAASESGVAPHVVKSWIDTGSNHDPEAGFCPYHEFYVRYQQARAHRLRSLLEVLPVDDPRVVMFLLRGEFSEIYGHQPKVSVSNTANAAAAAATPASDDKPEGINERQAEFLRRELLGVNRSFRRGG